VRGVPAVHGEQQRERAEQDGCLRRQGLLRRHKREGSHTIRPKLVGMRSLFYNDQDTLDERLRVRALAGADGAWLGIGVGLARAESTSCSGSSLTSPVVAATVRASCAPSAPVRHGRRELRAEHADLVHGAFAGRQAGGGGGDRDGRGGFCATWHRRALFGSSSATRLVCEAWSAGIGAEKAGG
jgi:hypothetical protein